MFLVALVDVFIHAFAFISGSYYLPLYFQVLGATPVDSGVKLIPFSLGSAIVSVAAGFLVTKLGRYRRIISGSFGLMAVGFALLATLDNNSSIANQEGFLIVCALGIGSLFQVPLLAIQASMPIETMATTTATYAVYLCLSMLDLQMLS